MSIRIAIADDADLTIIGARFVLEQDHRYQIIGTVRDAESLLDMVKSQRLDVILVNEWLYGLDILTIVEQIVKLSPQTQIMVMGALAEGLLIHDLFEAGVKGYLYKSDDLENCLCLAVDTIMRDRPYLSPTANAEYLVAVQSGQSNTHLDEEARSVLRLLAHGQAVNQIAFQLKIPRRRVYSVRERLRRRFGADTNEHLISRAAAEGFTYLNTP